MPYLKLARKEKRAPPIGLESINDPSEHPDIKPKAESRKPRAESRKPKARASSSWVTFVKSDISELFFSSIQEITARVGLVSLVTTNIRRPPHILITA
jgi:hypothetical protein